MNILLIFPILFILGSLFGFFIELFHRYSINKFFIKPGFLTGPYVPIYGIGLIVLYLFSNINLTFTNNLFLKAVFLSIISTFVVTILEYLTGLIFTKTLKIRLWDYSDRKGNIQGLVCPLYCFYWLVITFIYFIFIKNIIHNIVTLVYYSESLMTIVGFILGIVAIDFIYSLSVIYKVREYAKSNKVIMKYHLYNKN